MLDDEAKAEAKAQGEALDRLLSEEEEPKPNFKQAATELLDYTWKTRRSRPAFRLSPLEWSLVIATFAVWWSFETWLDRFPYPWPNIFYFSLIVLWVFHFARRFYRWYQS